MKQSFKVKQHFRLKLSYSIFLSAILLSLIIPVWGCKANESNQNEQAQTQESQQEQQQGTEIAKNSGENTQSAKNTGNTIVIMSTSLGNIKIKLFDDKAPITVKNFLSYVNDGFYDGTIFHRVIRGFMIQGGGFTPDMNQKATKAPIKNEATNGIKNERGTIAMARTNVVDSATAQFFINLVNNAFLNHSSENFGYAVFGQVVEGFEVIDKIAVVKTGNVDQFQDVPTESVVIKSVKVVEPKK